MKKTKYIIAVLAGILVMITGCQQEDYTLGPLTTPTNLDVTFEIVGVDAENPYGDGSGLVNFTVTAENYITFHFIFGDGSDDKIKQDGKVSHSFSLNGVNTYDVTVLAVGTGGITTSKTVKVEVYSSFSDPEAVLYLTGGTSKIWYWAADQQGHVGLGPNNPADDDGMGNLTYASWWSAGPFEKPCMYSDEFVFTKTETGVTFEQTAGPAFIPGTYAGKIGVGSDECYGEDVVPTMYGVKNVTFAPASTVATVAGGYRGTSMTVSDGGFLGWYVGKSEYEIIEITENILKVRIQEDATYAWYQILTTEKPVQEK